MRKDQAIYFVSGLIFGLLLGYFVFESVSQQAGTSNPSPAAASSPVGSAPGSGERGDTAPRRVLDRQELAALERMLEASPEDNHLRIRIGNLLLETGHFGEAIPYFEEALDREPENNHARNHLAMSLASLGRVDEAIAAYEEILRIDPGNPQGLVGLGRVRLYAKQDIQGGLAAWEELLRVAPESAEAQSIRDELEALKSAHSPD